MNISCYGNNKVLDVKPLVLLFTHRLGHTIWEVMGSNLGKKYPLRWNWSAIHRTWKNLIFASPSKVSRINYYIYTHGDCWQICLCYSFIVFFSQQLPPTLSSNLNIEFKMWTYCAQLFTVCLCGALYATENIAAKILSILFDTFCLFRP